MQVETNLSFRPINRAFNETFRPQRLSIGLVVPLESYPTSAVPTMARHVERAQLADELGFAALWLRDVPFNVPSFGDAGQMLDPFVYLGLLAGQTSRIALGVGSIILPLRHPAHVAKAAASADVLSGGRLLLGVASGDRPEEYPAMNMTFHDRSERFRESFAYIRHMAEDFPTFENAHGHVSRMDMLPKPTGNRVPMLITGGSRQHPDWVAEHGDGWITYPRNVDEQAQVIADYRTRILQCGEVDKPVSQSLYIDLTPEPDTAPRPIHLGFRAGKRFLLDYLSALRDIGVNHVALNLRFNQADMESTMKRVAEEILPHFADLRDVPMTKTILLTGSTDGLGLEAAKLLAGQGHTMLVHGRNATKLEAATAELSALPGAGPVEGYLADLSRLDDVEAMAKAVSEKHAHLDVLINNAGIFKTPHPITADGLDVRFVVNTLAPYVLTQRLLPIMNASGRVINLSSAAQAPVDLQAMAGHVQLAEMEAYSQSKLAITSWTKVLADQLGDAGPMIVAVNPGSLLATKMVKEGFGIDGKDMAIGSGILLRAALSDEFSDASGKYFDNDSGQFAPPHPAAFNDAYSKQIVAAMEALLARLT